MESLDLQQLAALAYQAVVQGHWWMLAAVLVLALVWALRQYGRRWAKLQPALDHPVVAWLLPVVVASLAALVLALASGEAVGAALLAALKVGAGAVFAFVGAKKIDEARKLGQAAAAEVKTPEDALKVLGGPQP
jgi:hypothetical protein